MVFELVLFTACLTGSVLVTVAAFYVGKWIVQKIERFFDGFRRL